MEKQHKRFLLMMSAIVPLSMLTVFILVLEYYPEHWQPVEAEIQTSKIVSTRPGTLQWSLMANVSYLVDGKTYTRKRLEVFRDSEQDVTVKEQASWPAGRKLQIYYNPFAPQSVSLVADGGREAFAVMAAILTPLGLVFLLLLYFAFMRPVSSDSST